MQFHATGLAGAWVIEIERHIDERGYFARSFCRREFAEHGLPGDFVQQSLSYNAQAGTLRGMHYQAPPHEEAKLVRCTRGAIYDVIVDLRPDQPSFLAWRGFTLSPDSGLSLFIPAGFAHGFQTLEDASEVAYQMDRFHRPGFEAGFRWDEAFFALPWPRPVSRMSERDRTWPDFAVETLTPRAG